MVVVTITLLCFFKYIKNVRMDIIAELRTPNFTPKHGTLGRVDNIPLSLFRVLDVLLSTFLRDTNLGALL